MNSAVVGAMRHATLPASVQALAIPAIPAGVRHCALQAHSYLVRRSGELLCISVSVSVFDCAVCQGAIDWPFHLALCLHGALHWNQYADLSNSLSINAAVHSVPDHHSTVRDR